MGMLKYDYSTKNFHRYGRTVPSEAVNEVYVSRAHMPVPVAEVAITVTWTGQLEVAEKVKPGRV